MNLFDHINHISRLEHGWCSMEKAKMLASIILATRPQYACEIGVWSGKSALPIMLAMQEVKCGKLIAIDPYSPMASAAGQPEEHAKWWGERVDHEFILSFFLSKIDEYHLDDHLMFMRKKSDEVDIASIPSILGLLHVDGNHGEQALKDVVKFSPLVRAGGFVVLDDLHWAGGAVSKSVEHLKASGFTELFRVVGKESSTGMENDWAVFQRNHPAAAANG